MLRRSRTTYRGGAKALLGALTTAAVLIVPASAGAQAHYFTGHLPSDFKQRFATCPTQDQLPPNAFFQYCLSVRAYDGELKMGKVTASIDDPIEAVVGIATQAGTSEPLIVPAKGSGAPPKPVKISGGILGVPALDPLLDLSLGTLSLSASPAIGAIGAEPGPPDELQPTHLKRITLPLSIKLNNTLFGKNCQIASPDKPIQINLTTGTTSPPAGVAPMVGQPPVASPETMIYNLLSVQPNSRTGTGAVSVDNTFAVPGAKNCDLLPASLRPLGGLLGGLFGPQKGLFDPLINSIAGLPSGPGKNHLRLKVDTAWLTLGATAADLETVWFESTPGRVDFGDLPVGQVATKRVTFTNPRTEPLVFTNDDAVPAVSDTARESEFQVVGGNCAGATLERGESCFVDVKYAPTSAGVADTFVSQRHVGNDAWDPTYWGGAQASPWVHATGNGT